jgi:hypothetical protein
LIIVQGILIEKRELRRQATDTWRKEKQDVKIFAEIDPLAVISLAVSSVSHKPCLH